MNNEKPKMIRRIFRLRKELSIGFYITDFIFRKIFRQNSGVRWAVHHSSTIHCPEKLVVGKGTFPGDSPGVYINASNGVHIGDYTNLGPNVGIVSVNHDFINNDAQVADAPIKIGRFCWLGMGAIVLPGVELGDFTIVGAGSVVTKSFTDGYCVIAGNPATIIKHLNKTECDAFASSKG
jgi:acetyltransferase-like isoleucine patch superfamily enzyme